MVCIYCSGKLGVGNSRPQKKLNQVWRRRKCVNCGAALTSIEAIDLSAAISVQVQNSSEAFSRDKLFISIFESCKHRKTALADATALTDTVIGRLLLQIEDASLSKEKIRQTIVEILKNFDQPASVHYQAYHQ
jgi:transcriptional repressor NrdR